MPANFSRIEIACKTVATTKPHTFDAWPPRQRLVAGRPSSRRSTSSELPFYPRSWVGEGEGEREVPSPPHKPAQRGHLVVANQPPQEDKCLERSPSQVCNTHLTASPAAAYLGPAPQPCSGSPPLLPSPRNARLHRPPPPPHRRRRRRLISPPRVDPFLLRCIAPRPRRPAHLSLGHRRRRRRHRPYLAVLPTPS